MYLTVTVKAQAHSVTHCQLWKRQRNYVTRAVR